MADGVPGAMFVDIGLEFSGRDLEIVGKEGAQIEAAVVGTRQQIGAIAGGDYQGLFHTRELSQPRDRIRQARFWNSEPLADLQGSAAMVDADELEDHWHLSFLLEETSVLPGGTPTDFRRGSRASLPFWRRQSLFRQLRRREHRSQRLFLLLP